ncbi:MAG: GH92 family glycosyl hydrolase, partial [Bacteroidota bacterium]
MPYTKDSITPITTKAATAWWIPSINYKSDNMHTNAIAVITQKIYFVIFFLSIGTLHAQQHPAEWVDPFIGTDGFGHTFPGATTPFGMVQLSPDTRTTGWENCSGYHSSNNTIIGFSHLHLSGTGAADYGDIMFMPTIGNQIRPGDESNPMSGYRSSFKKESEIAKPGYYAVVLDDHGIKVELTATTRTGIQRYTFPESDKAYIILDLNHGIEDKATETFIRIIDNKTIQGYRRSKGWAKDQIVFFHSEFSEPFSENAIFDTKSLSSAINASTVKGGSVASFGFKTKKGQRVIVKTGISTVSAENAKLNLATEAASWDFDGFKRKAFNSWNEELSRIKVDDGTNEQKVVFYTSLYHCMIHPSIMSDVDGRYRGMDDKIHQMDRGNMYTVFSLWDTFRALHPLMTIIDPDRAQEFVRALLRKYRESGTLPVWELASNETGCMIGYHSVPVIVDTYMKGLKDFDTTLAIEACVKSAMMDHLGLKYYKELGYIPADKENESVSKTLEYAYDDWCIAQMAKSMGKQPEADLFASRAMYYLNVYDKTSGFVRGKKNGNWVSPFDPYEVSGIYTEANAWQYNFFMPHDIPGMMKLNNGLQNFTARLDSLFSANTKLTGRSQPDISGMIGQYAHGNEPSHHMAYLYNYTGKPYRTAQLTRKIMSEMYGTSRDGLSGNEDCGQMSAWFVLSALGIYPVSPGNNSYEIGSPIFKKAIINNGSGGITTILSNASDTNDIYVESMLINGKPSLSPLKHISLTGGSTIEFRMSSLSDKYMKSITPIHSDNIQTVMMPFVLSCEKSFFDSCKVSMSCHTEGAEIRYTKDGTEPNESSAVYREPIIIKETTKFHIKAFKKDYLSSTTEHVQFLKLPYKKVVTYKNEYSHNYTG